VPEDYASVLGGIFDIGATVDYQFVGAFLNTANNHQARFGKQGWAGQIEQLSSLITGRVNLVNLKSLIDFTQLLANLPRGTTGQEFFWT
jgi:hypothetical protein